MSGRSQRVQMAAKSYVSRSICTISSTLPQPSIFPLYPPLPFTIFPWLTPSPSSPINGGVCIVVPGRVLLFPSPAGDLPPGQQWAEDGPRGRRRFGAAFYAALLSDLGTEVVVGLDAARSAAPSPPSHPPFPPPCSARPSSISSGPGGPVCAGGGASGARGRGGGWEAGTTGG